MAIANRIFISFAIEDSHLRDFLVGQGRNEKTPFSFTDMSVKQPWDSAWKTQCRTRIRGCDGVIGLITSSTPKADGQLWELSCANEENVPVFLMYGDSTRPGVRPAEISGRRIHTWSWSNIESFLERL